MKNSLEAFHFWLQGHLDDLLNQCTSEAEKQTLLGASERLAVAYNRITNEMLAPGNAEIARLNAQLNSVQTEVSEAVERGEEIAKIVNGIATGVTVAAKIASVV